MNSTPHHSGKLGNASGKMSTKFSTTETQLEVATAYSSSGTPAQEARPMASLPQKGTPTITCRNKTQSQVRLGDERSPSTCSNQPWRDMPTTSPYLGRRSTRPYPTPPNLPRGLDPQSPLRNLDRTHLHLPRHPGVTQHSTYNSWAPRKAPAIKQMMQQKNE